MSKNARWDTSNFIFLKPKFESPQFGNLYFLYNEYFISNQCDNGSD